MFKKLFIPIMLFLAVPCSAHAVREAQFAYQYANFVEPYYEAGTFGEFSGTDGLRLNYAAFEQEEETGALVVLHGKSESYIKYAEVVYDIRGLGLTCYLMDARGFGFSERILEDDPQKVYVERFDDYVADLKIFIDTVVKARPHSRIFLLSHSLGGCIAARYLEKYPGDIDAAVLSSPMLAIDTGSFPPAVAYLVAAMATGMGMGTEYALGQGPRDAEPWFFEATTTHSLARWAKWEEELIPDNPEIRSGGATYGWVKRSLEAGAHARLQAARVTTPVLLLQAGQDTIVEPAGQDRFCDAAQDCTRVYMTGSRHEILMETDAIRDVALETIRSFLRRYMQ